MPALCHQVSMMDEGGNTRDDMFLPKGTEEAEKLAEIISEHWTAGKEMSVTVVKVREGAHGVSGPARAHVA